MLKDDVTRLAGDFHDKVIKTRRWLHMHPELSFAEKETSKYVQTLLKDIDVPFTSGWADTGIVAIIEGNRPDSNVIALRADLDALPIQEKNAVPYASKNDGVMHACGHDVHTSSLLGVAMILKALSKRFDGSVKLIFQPGEERMPGGASILIKEGVLENPRPAGILGQHVYPLLEAGKVGFRPGKMMASADEITLTIKGRGGHGAVPQFTIDPVAITAQVITGLQQVVSRSSDPTMPSVLTFGKINSDGGTFNVIPGSVQLLGTFRTFDESWRAKALQKVKEIAMGIAQSFGAECDVHITPGYPYLVNDAPLTERCAAAARSILGEENVVDLPMRLTAEDFSYYTHHAPGCFYRLGVANASRGINSPVHTPTFDIDENALVTGPAVMSWLAISELSH